MEAIKTFCDQHNMEIIGTVPLDDEMVEAERKEKAPYDFAPHSAGVESIRKIAQSVDELAGG
jgi:CO dehydrogenase maturation factor